MSSVFDERTAYLKSPYFKKHEYGDFTPFYVAITICTIIGVALFVLNIALGCCSRHSKYWNDRHTGNRWIVTFWTSTPHQQPPIDLTELEGVEVPKTQVVYEEPQAAQHQTHPPQQLQYLELKKRESDI